MGNFVSTVRPKPLTCWCIPDHIYVLANSYKHNIISTMQSTIEAQETDFETDCCICSTQIAGFLVIVSSMGFQDRKVEIHRSNPSLRVQRNQTMVGKFLLHIHTLEDHHTEIYSLFGSLKIKKHLLLRFLRIPTLRRREILLQLYREHTTVQIRNFSVAWSP